MHQYQNGKKIGWISAGAIVVANMVGTGAFTTLGFQLKDLQNTWTIISIWILGGLFSLFGAFSYAELGTRLPKSGGEYFFLSRIYHPFVGYLSGWVSLTVGFAASIALSAMAMGAYLGKFSILPGKGIAILAIVIISLIHSFNIRQSSLFQNAFTLLKLFLLFFFIFVAADTTSSRETALDWSANWKEEVFRPSYAVAFIIVTYAFSGWNAAAYIVEEIKAPKKNLPRALIGGTILVSILFIFLQLGFLKQASLEHLAGHVEIGQIVAELMLGDFAGQVVSFLIALLLIASISAMVWVGPRVTRAMAEDFHIWQFFSRDNASGIPVRAIWLQTVISILMVLTSSFEQVLLYSGFILQLFTSLTVAGVIILRLKERKSANHYMSPGYPFVQIIYLVFSIFILAYLVQDRPYESFIGLLNLLVGAVSYWWSLRFTEKQYHV